MLLALFKLLVDALDKLPLLFGLDSSLAHLEHAVGLACFEGLEHLPVHVAEYQVCYIFEVHSNKLEQVASVYLLEVGLSVLVFHYLYAFLNNFPDARSQVLE